MLEPVGNHEMDSVLLTCGVDWLVFAILLVC